MDILGLLKAIGLRKVLRDTAESIGDAYLRRQVRQFRTHMSNAGFAEAMPELDRDIPRWLEAIAKSLEATATHGDR